MIHGDCRTVLCTLPDGSVQCCVTSPPYFGLRSYLPQGHPDKHKEIGTERHPDEYVANLVAVFHELRRVMRDDGTLWLNLGDSYSAGVGDHKVKDRLMIPAMVAIALRGDGWWLRDEIVWNKPRTTPAPVKDRTVTSHEMIYLLSKQPSYYFDWEAIEEPSLYPGLARKAGKAFRDPATHDPNSARKRPSADRTIIVRDTRRARSVWSVSPSPYVDQHFATMPPEIAERCIRAGTRTGDTVIDPFFGVGTTGLVADRLGRECIGIELSSGHAAHARERIVGDAPLFGDAA